LAKDGLHLGLSLGERDDYSSIATGWTLIVIAAGLYILVGSL